MTECVLQRFLLLSIIIGSLFLTSYVAADGRSRFRSPFLRHRRQSGINHEEQEDKHDVKRSICLEPSCVISSASILQTLDTSINPCDDFYQFSCGGWLKDNDIPSGRSAHGRFEEVRKQNNRIIKKLLESESDVFNGKVSEGVRKAKDFYNACMNLTYIDEAGAQPLEMLIDMLGGWSLVDTNDASAWRTHPKNINREAAPVGIIHRVAAYDIKRRAAEDASVKQTDEDTRQAGDLRDFILKRGGAESRGDDDESDWMDVLISAHLLALDPLFGMWVNVDDKDSDSYIIAFSQSGLQLMSIEFYNDTSLTDAYMELGAMTALLLTFGENYNSEGKHETKFFKDSLEKMKTILEFETKLAMAFVPDDELQDPEETYHKMSLEEFAATIPKFDMPSYLNQMLNTTISEDEDVLVYTPDYFVRLNDIIEETPQQVIQDYIVWQTMIPMLPYLSSSFRSAYGQFMDALTGGGKSGGGGAPLWEICVSETQDALGSVTGALFVQDHMQNDTKTEVAELLTNIRQAFIAHLPSIDWMEESTKSKARTKATSMADKIGWPDWLLKPDKLDESVKWIQVDPDDQFLNMLWMRVYIMAANLNFLGRPVDKREFHMSADTVNAYYDVTANEMAFPAGIMQAPFYSHSNPMAVNYGAIGLVLGHELTHGFDDNGRKYDEFGNLNDWWDDKSAAQYEKRAQCIIDQYNNYKVADNVTINGLTTLGENIADNGGAQTAYRALQSWLKTKPGQDQPTYPGLQDYTQEQLFFIGMAQEWCDKSTPESILLRVRTNEHAPRQFRVRGIVSNMDEFTEAFQCPPDAPMNPQTKCQVW